MIRLRVSGKLVGVLLLGGFCLLLLCRLLAVEKPRPPHITARPPTPSLALFRSHDDKPDKTDEIVGEVRDKSERRSVVQPRREVEVWGKASIAEYLWAHVLGGNATTYANGLLKHGEMTVGNLELRFRSGPGVIPNTVPNTLKYLVLVLNGKDHAKIKFSRSWLDYLVHFRHLRRTALVVLGDERCDNSWLRPYLRSQGGLIDVVFLVYDSPLVDGKEVFQWPLGVATYRGFPHFRSDLINVKNERTYLCNFLGTVYKNSSRETLMSQLQGSKHCLVQARDTWVPSESYASMEKYLRTVSDADLTLSPIGKNTECYRIYEALALGSVPVVEDVGAGGVGNQCVSPLRLLKAHNAPLIYVKSWDDVSGLLAAEARMSVAARVARRRKLVVWYEGFKREMRSFFLATLRRVFFQESGPK